MFLDKGNILTKKQGSKQNHRRKKEVFLMTHQMIFFQITPEMEVAPRYKLFTQFTLLTLLPPLTLLKDWSVWSG